MLRDRNYAEVWPMLAKHLPHCIYKATPEIARRIQTCAHKPNNRAPLGFLVAPSLPFCARSQIAVLRARIAFAASGVAHGA